MAKLKLFPFLFLAASVAFPQASSQQISGIVSYSSGSVVPNAKVTGRITGTGLARETQSNASGGYAVTGLPIGRYDIETSAAGFKTSVRKGVRVEVNAKVAVDIQLKFGTINESTTVNVEL